MRKLQQHIPLPNGINLIDDSLIADNEAAEGTRNISFVDGMPQTRKGYVKAYSFNFITEPKSIYNYMRNGSRILLVACGTTLKKLNGVTFDDITGVLGSDIVDFLTYPCLIGQIDAPYNIVTAAAAGTLGAGTYYYKVTTLTALGESLASAEVSQVLSATGGVKLSWKKMEGATGYKVYGRTANAELLIATIADPNTVTYTDSGAFTPSGALPTTNTTYALPYSDKCFLLDGSNYRYYDGDAQLRNVVPYNPTDYEIGAYGTNVLITTPDEVVKQKYILNDNERIWVAGYGKLVRFSHLQRPDYFPSTHVWKLTEDCTGFSSFMGEVMVFTENECTLISGSTPFLVLSDSYVLKKLPGGYGCSADRSIVEGDNALYWANKNGVYRYRYLPSGFSIPECISEFILPTGHTVNVSKWFKNITDWSKVFANFYEHQYRIHLGNGHFAIFDTIQGTWTYYEYDKSFNCGTVFDHKLNYASPYIYEMDHSYVEGDGNRGLNDDGVAILHDLYSKYFDFRQAANKKKFKKFFFTLYSELISYDIDLDINIDSERIKVVDQIINEISRWGEFAFGDKITTKNTNLNYPIAIHHKSKKYNIQYHMSSSGLNMAWLLKSVELLFKLKELK